MTTPATRDPEVISHAEVRDEDSTIHLEAYEEPEGDITVAIWGSEDTSPDVALAYTLITEAELIGFLSRAGYTVTRQAS